MGLASNAPLLAAWAADRLLKSSRPANLTAFARFIGTYQPDNNQPVSTVNKRGHDVLHDPLVNKVSAVFRCSCSQLRLVFDTVSVAGYRLPAL